VVAPPKAVVPIVAVLASSAVSMAHAGNPLKPDRDPNPGAAIVRLGPDPVPGAARATAQPALTGPVGGSTIRPQAAGSALRAAATSRSAPVRRRLRPGAARTSPAHSRHREGARSAIGAELAAVLRHRRILPVPVQPGIGDRLVRSSVRERAPLLAAAAALAAVVLGSGSLLMLGRRRVFSAEA
jgi:hypothetical protein